MKYTIGIDTGLHGAIAKIDSDMRVISLEDIPVIQKKVSGKNRSEYNYPQLKNIFCSLTKGEDVFVMIEKTHPQAVFLHGTPQTNHNLGLNYGYFLGLLYANGVPFEIVSAKEWQKGFFTVDKSTDSTTKTCSYSCAARLFPGAVLSTPKGRVLDGRADALLIAEHARRRIAGQGGVV
jgi:hypothetical protein